MANKNRKEPVRTVYNRKTDFVNPMDWVQTKYFL